MKKTLIIGVAGGTGSGKTTVARSILERLKAADAALIPQDAYYRDRSTLSMEERADINYDHPEAIDIELLQDHLKRLKQGEAVQRPVYSFVTHTRLEDTVVIEPCDALILEGILVLADDLLRELMDVKIYVETDDDIRFIRRLKRDIRKRGRSVESVIEQYLDRVRPMHLEFVQPSRRYADIIIPEGGRNDVAIDLICSRIMHELRTND